VEGGGLEQGGGRTPSEREKTKKVQRNWSSQSQGFLLADSVGTSQQRIAAFWKQRLCSGAKRWEKQLFDRRQVKILQRVPGGGLEKRNFPESGQKMGI